MRTIKVLFVALLLMNACENNNVSVAKVYLNQNFATLIVGEELELEAFVRPDDAQNKAVTWSSNREAVAVVSAEGVVKAEAEGMAIITVASVDGGKTADCVVTVRAEFVSVTNVNISHGDETLEIGGQLLLTAEVEPAGATNQALTWNSSAPNVATVENGLVTAVSAGTATVTVSATDGSGVKAECKITVTDTPDAPTERTMIVGYIPNYTISVNANPDSYSYLHNADRVVFIGIFPDAAGNWTLNGDPNDTEAQLIAKIDIIRRALRPEQEFFLAVGGGARATPQMHAMGRTEALREAYAEALVNFAHQQNFDGIDMDWETDWRTPVQYVPLAGYTDLMTRIRNKMNALPDNTTLKKLTTALATGADSRQLAVAVANIVDEVSVMLYDIYEPASGSPAAHAPMSQFVERLEAYVTAGIPKSKLLAGVPFYGGNRAVNPTSTRAYRQLVSDAAGQLTADLNTWNNFNFNGVNLIREKKQYVINNGYKGMMIWEFTQDVTFSNSLSLLRAMRETVDAAFE